MAPSSSSTRKAARLAQKGRGKRVRFQGGTVFPLIVAAVLVFGLALIVYARASRPDADASAPQPNIDHWHAAYGFQLCSDEPNIVMSGDLEELDTNGGLANQNFRNTGVHSHDDGVIHWHPYGVQASGKRAKLGVFLNNYDVGLSNTELELPEGGLMYEETKAPVADDFPLVYEEDETKCDGEDAELKVVVWTDYTDPDSDQQYTADFDNIRFDRDGLVIVIAFVPNDVDVVMPSWAANLPALGAADSATPPNDSGVPVATVPESTPDTTATEDTATDDSTATATGTTEPEATPDETTGESSPPTSEAVASSAPPTTE